MNTEEVELTATRGMADSTTVRRVVVDLSMEHRDVSEMKFGHGMKPNSLRESNDNGDFSTNKCIYDMARRSQEQVSRENHDRLWRGSGRRTEVEPFGLR